MILAQTHSNRWVARKRRNQVVLGIITLVSLDGKGPVYRSELVSVTSTERVLLRDESSLDVAFAVLLAAIQRAGAGAALPLDDEYAA